MIFNQLWAIVKKYKFSFNIFVKDIFKEVLEVILYGGDKFFKVKVNDYNDYLYDLVQEGIVNMLLCWYDEMSFEKIWCWVEEFMIIDICLDCNGYCLKQELFYFKVSDKYIGELVEMDFIMFCDWMEGLEF